jgi:UDP-N-acetylmuramate-alanine ligase
VRHNVQNALAAIAIATDLGVSDDAIQLALAEFNGVGRRFQRYGSAERGRRYVHADRRLRPPPVEMAATIAAARGAFPPPPRAGVPAAPPRARATASTISSTCCRRSTRWC